MIRRQAQPIVANHLGRHALTYLAFLKWMGQGLQIGMCMKVDETRAHKHPIGDEPLSGSRSAQRANRGNPIALHRHVRPVPGAACAVYHSPR